eukprot:8750175-Ditylum_brightwellii.AAC.1
MSSNESRSIVPNMTTSDHLDGEPNLNLDETHQDDIYNAFNNGVDVSRITTESSCAPVADEHDTASFKKTLTDENGKEHSKISEEEKHNLLHIALNDAYDISRITDESINVMVIKNQDTSFTKLLTSKNDLQLHSSKEKQRLAEVTIQKS